MSFTPHPERNLVSPDKEEKVTESGFILATDDRDKPLVGRIETLGAQSRFDAAVVGKKIAFSRYGADEIRVGTNTFFVVSDQSILGFYD